MKALSPKALEEAMNTGGDAPDTKAMPCPRANRKRMQPQPPKPKVLLAPRKSRLFR